MSIQKIETSSVLSKVVREGLADPANAFKTTRLDYSTSSFHEVRKDLDGKTVLKGRNLALLRTTEQELRSVEQALLDLFTENRTKERPSQTRLVGLRALIEVCMTAQPSNRDIARQSTHNYPARQYQNLEKTYNSKYFSLISNVSHLLTSAEMDQLFLGMMDYQGPAMEHRHASSRSPISTLAMIAVITKMQSGNYLLTDQVALRFINEYKNASDNLLPSAEEGEAKILRDFISSPYPYFDLDNSEINLTLAAFNK